MNKKTLFKQTLTIITAAALIVSAASAANAAELDIESSRIGSPLGETEISSAIESGKVVISENSGVLPAKTGTICSVLKPSGALPSSYRSECTSVKDQGSYGTCWSFSTMATLETFLLKDGKGSNDLSEQHLCWWSTAQYNSNGYNWQLESINTGAPLSAGIGYLTSWQGPKSESDIAYIGTGGQNETLPYNMDSTPSSFAVTGAVYVERDIETVKTAIMDYGAVCAAYNSDKYYNADGTAFCYPPVDINSIFSLDNPITLVGHAISVVGWDDNYPKENFSSDYQPQNDGAWLIKNSWGDYSGEDGYFWMSYEDGFIFQNDVFGPAYAVTSARTITQYDKLYQLETAGAVGDTGIYNGYDGSYYRNITYINRFNFDSSHPIIDEVVFETQSIDADYTVYYIPISYDAPTDDTSKWIKLGSGTTDHSGYINVNVEGFFVPEGDGAIGVTIDTTRSEKAALIGVNNTVPGDVEGTYSYRSNTPKKTSYYLLNGNMIDIVDRYNNLGDDDGGNFVIKVIATSNRIGDTNLDGRVSLKDAFHAQRIAAGAILYTDEDEQINSDVNFDGNITALDAMMIQKQVSGLISSF